MKKNLRLLSSCLLMMVGAAVITLASAVRAQSLWNATNGVSANTNWSSAENWVPNTVPTATSSVLFNDSGNVAGPGIIDNVVDASTTIQQLVFKQTNGFHNMLILPGITLTVTNSVATSNLLAGTETTASPSTLIVTNTISGAGGSLVVSNPATNSVIAVRQISSTAGSHTEVLDMTGLDNFNATIGNVWVGVYPGTTTTRPQGTLLLAKTNVITAFTVGTKTAPALDIGDTGSSPDVGNTLALGISNSIAADTIEVGNQRSGGIIIFNPALTNGVVPSLYLRGNSAPRVVTFNIGDNSSATASIGSTCSGNVDFSGGIVDAMVDSMILGNGQSLSGTGAGTSRGTLTMTAGNMDVNTLEIGYQNNSGASAANTGTLNVSGGTLTVNNSLRIAFYGGSGGMTTGTLNITNGTVAANALVAGGGTSGINMVGGTLMVTNTIGSAAVPLGTLTISSGAILDLFPANGVTPCSVTTLTSDGTGVINVGSLPPLAGYPSEFPLISYQNGSGSGQSFAVGTLPGIFQGFVSNDNSSTIWLVVTNGPNLASIKWKGGINNLWDTSTQNWLNNATAAKYQDPDVVTFDDSASTSQVNITGTFAPGGWLQNNNTLNYTFSGTGSITGPGGLTMNGTASVTLSQTGGDNFTGGITVNSGKVILDDANSTISGGLSIANGATAQIGNNDANGSLPSGSLDNQGTLIFDRSDAVTVDSIIPGIGALVQNGSGTVTLSASNTYSGTTFINAGTLALTNSGSIAVSPQVNVAGGTLDVSGVSGTATLTSLFLTNAAVTVSVGYPQTNLFVNNVVMGGTTNLINVSSLPAVASYPTTLTLLAAVGGVSGFNMGAGSLPAGYGGTVSLSPDTTSILLTLTNGPIGTRSSVIWTGADVLKNINTNWSDSLNWQLPGAPVPGDNVIFNNTEVAGGSALSSPGAGITGFMPDFVNNFVDRDFTIASLTYTNNSATYENTAITNGATLSITNFMTVGAVDSASLSQQEFVNVAGTNATLNVDNTNSNFEVWVGDSGSASSFALLDLSALDNFTANVSKLTVGACAVNNAVNRPSGILYLARTNTINCAFSTTSSESGSTTGNTAIDLADCNQNAGPISYIYLGQVNVISADTIGIARQKASGNVLFNPIYANIAPYPSITLKGFSSSTVSFLDVGDGIGNSGTTSGTGDLNLTGGLVTASVDVLNVGRASGATSGSGTTTGTLEFDAGTITANTVNIGLQSATGTKVGVGTVTVSTNNGIGAGANLVVSGNLNLGVNVNSSSTIGTLNINGGSVQANNIIAGANGALSTVSLTGGSLIVTGAAGSPAAPLTTLSLSDGTKLQLTVNGGANVTNVVATTISVGGSVNLKIGSLFGVTTGVTYPLISYTGTDPFGSLNLALPSGYVGTLIDDTADSLVGLKLTTVPPPPQPARITGIGVSGTTLTLTATNGADGGRFVLLGSTNVALPLNQWTPILTNNFDANGNVNLSTNVVNSSAPQQFYNLSQ